MKVALVNLADSLFGRSQSMLIASAMKFNINTIISWKYRDFKMTPFFKENFFILSQTRGIGYWLWKPYIIQQALADLSPGDILIYSDCGIEITNDLTPLIDICMRKSDILVFNNHNFINKAWTKRDCFVLMDCDTPEYWNAVQIDGAFQLYKKTELTSQFVDDWLQYGKNKNIITDLPNICNLPNFPEFIDHRHDQSILSLLSIKYGLEIFRNPSQSGIPHKRYFQNSTSYGALLNHHRMT